MLEANKLPEPRTTETCIYKNSAADDELVLFTEEDRACNREKFLVKSLCEGQRHFWNSLF